MAGGSLVFGSSSVGALPFGWLTVTSASQRSSRVPRSAGTWVVSRPGRSSMNAVDTSPAMKSGSSRTDCRNGMFVLTPRIRNSASARRARATAAWNVRARQVSLTSIESKCGADLDAGVDRAAVQPDAGAAGRAVRGDRAGVRAESVGRVLGGDPALQGGAVDPHLVLGQAEIVEALPAGDPHLGLDQVDVGDLLGDGVLYLDPGVHLDEDVLAGPLALGLDQELDRPGTRVVDRLRELHRVARTARRAARRRCSAPERSR